MAVSLREDPGVVVGLGPCSVAGLPGPRGLLRSLLHLTAAADTLATRCIDGITANREHLADTVARSVGTVTALTPFIGYANGARIAKQALATGDRVPDLVVTQGSLTVEQVQQVLDPHRLTELHATPPGAAILQPPMAP